MSDGVKAAESSADNTPPADGTRETADATHQAVSVSLRSAVPAPKSPEPAADQPAAMPAAPARPRRRFPPPQRWPRLVAWAVTRWATRPAGRLTLPGLLIAGLVGLTGTAGAYLVPASAGPSPTPNAAVPPVDPEPDASVTAAPEGQPLPTVLPTVAPAGGREAGKLAGWAAPLAARLQVPQPALEAYGYAQWVLEQTQPNCHLSWTTLAAIGKVESDHGRAGGATLTPDGRAYPAIVGAPLDGQDGRRRILDTDQGRLDNDAVYDRAVGPMQFIPSTWTVWKTDADSDGLTDPHDIDDAALTAAKYLCANSRDLATPDGWRDAVLAYNNVQSYLTAVLDQADRYGRESRNTQ